MECCQSALSPEAVFGEMQKKWVWLLLLGIVLLVLGVVGLGMTMALTMLSVRLFGILLLIGGISQFFHTFVAKGWKSIILSLLIAVMYEVGGIAIIRNPLATSAGLTILLAISLVCVGILRIGIAIQHRGFATWILPLISGIVSILLGVVIMAEWPVSGLVIIGLFIAVELVINGISCVAIALTAKSLKTA